MTTIGECHRRTGTVVTVSDEEVRRFVHAPLDVVRGVVPRAFHDDVRLLGAALGSGLVGRRVSVGWAHGDYNPVNVLTFPDGWGASRRSCTPSYGVSSEVPRPGRPFRAATERTPTSSPTACPGR